jgi:hypothetical protein
LHPRDVPTFDVVSRSLSRQTREFGDALHLQTGTWNDNRTALCSLHALVDRLRYDGEREAGSQSNADEHTHDEFFGIARISGDPAAIFFHMLLRAHWIFLNDLDETPFRIAVEKLDALDDAFKTLQCRALGISDMRDVRVSAWIPAQTPYRSMDRWINGHQVFAALTQGLIAAFAELRDALLEGDEAATAAAVDVAARVLRGSGAALEFTGDIPSDDYVDIIRPRMQPPFVPDTFSGLLSSDHRYFISFLKEIKPLLSVLEERNPSGHQQIKAAVSGVYDSHKFVCERLVGKSPSLMMSGASSKSGAEQIAKFKALRMKVFENGARANAATEPPKVTTP